MSTQVRKYGDPILREICLPVEKVGGEEKDIFSHMSRLLFETQALGIAAPQIGISRRLIAVRFDGDLIQIANPVIAEGQGEGLLTEGCLSIPEIFVKVSRSRKIIIEGIDEKGKKRSIKIEGILARALQHEIDHLDGVLIIDHTDPKKKDKLRHKLEQIANYTQMVLRIKNKQKFA